MFRNQTCGKCMFWVATKNNTFGECRRYPPATVGCCEEGKGCYPVINKDTKACGEFKPEED